MLRLANSTDGILFNASKVWIGSRCLNLTTQTQSFYTTAANSATTQEIVENPYQQTTTGIVLWSTVYGLMTLVGLCGNLGICWIVASVKKMRTVTNIFLASTALADCNVIVFNTIFNFTFAVNGNWYFGLVFCHFINFLPVAAVVASISCITVISLDRFMVIMYPLRQRIPHRTAGIIIFGIWILSMGVAFPQAHFATVNADGPRVVCSVEFPEGYWGRSRLIYQVCFMILSYWLPLTILAVTYVAMAIRLRHRDAAGIGHVNVTQQRKDHSNKKAVRMMTLVVVVFAICWLPYQVYFLVGFMDPTIFSWTKMQQVYLAVFWLAMSSAMYNPLIYCWTNKRFRDEFKRLCNSQMRGFHRSHNQGVKKIYRHPNVASATSNDKKPP